MKKIWTSIIVTIMTVVSVTCFTLGAQIDLDSLSDEEIIALSQEIQKQIVDRNIQKTAHVPAGDYLVGQDIPAGTYSVKNNYTDEEHGAYIAVYADEEKSEMLSGDNLYAGDEKVVTLTEGTIFQVRHETLDVTVFAGVSFE